MLKRILTVTAILWCSTTAIAQSEEKTEKEISHYLGIQANPLFQQLINFGGAPEVNNPFLLKYAIHNNATLNELAFGLGFDLSTSEDKNGLKSTTYDLAFRVGYSKKYKFSKRFEVGIGGDLVVNYLDIKTVNVQSFNFSGGFDSTITTTTSDRVGYGGGFQVNLAYSISKNIQIGTEATYYYLIGRDRLIVRSENFRRDFIGGPVRQNNNYLEDENKRSELTTTLPVAIYLIFKF